MATQMQLGVILAGNRIATRVLCPLVEYLLNTQSILKFYLLFLLVVSNRDTDNNTIETSGD